jgi:hypothetical protein
MLARFPLRPCGERNRAYGAVSCAPGASCALCGKTDSQEDMTRTDCCDQVRGPARIQQSWFPPLIVHDELHTERDELDRPIAFCWTHVARSKSAHLA